MSKTRCEAKNPATCRYHGTKLDESQWLPDYAEAHARLDDLNARAMSNHNSRSTTQALEAERQQAILDVDASRQGVKQLVDQIDRNRYGQNPNFWAEEKLKAALAHREHKLAAAAIADFEGLAEDEYTPSTAERLFSGLTNSNVLQQGDTTVLAYVTEPNAAGINFEEYNLKNPADRERMVAKRREFETSEAARHLYNNASLRQDVLGYEGSKIDQAGSSAIVSKDGVAYARVEFNQDGSFNRAVAKHPQGYSMFLESSTAFRSYARDVLEGERDLVALDAYLAV